MEVMELGANVISIDAIERTAPQAVEKTGLMRSWHAARRKPKN